MMKRRRRIVTALAGSLAAAALTLGAGAPAYAGADVSEGSSSDAKSAAGSASSSNPERTETAVETQRPQPRANWYIWDAYYESDAACAADGWRLINEGRIYAFECWWDPVRQHVLWVTETP